MSRNSTIAAITLIALALVALQYWNSQRGAPQPLPPLARDLPKDAKLAGSVFDARVRHRFPSGTPGGAVAKELAAEGFRIEADRRSAVLVRRMYPCDVVWRVAWRLDGAAAARGSYGIRCP